jgi:dTDP-4-dehydrorhamnose reductase
MIGRIIEMPRYGIYHANNAGSCSWYEFAVEICARAGLDPDIARISSERLARPARRPAFSVLDNTWFAHVAGGRLPDWREGLAAHLAQSRATAGKEQS